MSRDALIVGINQYQALPRLTAAAKDAEGVANLLETYGDFRVRRLPEIIQDQRPKIGQQTLVSTQQLENSLVRLLLPKGDHIPEAVFFYFSGHGLQREIGIREGYLATSDTQPDISNSGLSLSWLRRLIRHSPIRQIIVILDCCHSGEFLSLKDESWQGRDGQSYLFIAASREYEEAYESLNSDYSVLTQAVVSGLRPQQSDHGRVTSVDLVASITNQLSNEIQQPLFEQSGSEIVITRHSERSLPPTKSIPLIARLKQYSFNFCPYCGPQPYEAKHAEYFFGRENLIQDMLLALQHTDIYALVGASGSGKTSLLQAGLIPRLAQGHDIEGSEHWLVRYVTPNAHPLKTLAAAFVDADQEINVAAQLLQAENILRNEPKGLAHLVSAALLKHPTAKKFWLIIDQFEELLTTTNNPQTQNDREQVIKALIKALHCPAIDLGVIISLRSDAMDHLLTHGELFSALEGHQVVIPPMSYQEIREVIEKPAEKLGLRIDPYLVHNLTLDLTGAPGELALLQNTLHELWQHRSPNSCSKGSPCLSLESYMKLGRLSNIITSRATTLYESLPVEEQAVARRIFLSLCDLGEGHIDQGRRVRKIELVNHQFPKALIDRVLKKFIMARLIVVDQAIAPLQPSNRTVATNVEIPEETTIQLAHKSLVSDWSLLRQWLHSNRTTLRQRRDIEDRAWIWHHRGQLKCPDYLLGQRYLQDVSQFLMAHSQDLSDLAQRFVQISRRTVICQRWRTRGIAVMLPLTIMTGMTASLVRQTPDWRFRRVATGDAALATQLPNPISTMELQPQLPTKWGMMGADSLVMTGQILVFRRQHPQSELNHIPITQLASLIKPGMLTASSASLPDTSSTRLNDGEVSAP
ncbi:peptidase c14 caspase catalytic subunit p20 [Leptolyngbya sp. Heron Island J]|uniref:nSTAND1 domain-containing NTPase n=1 Tax=Leptolyngbya sp. Heron Island J TaxID=1385935 RepID=UPI0003B99E69|nr:caspase family protein [Leptolyngbya sp. Heron Island J]ESA37531.1 peptidase c14 caspase catalytic subunit p20 [Leptolyngbya sp. Heron Island J]